MIGSGGPYVMACPVGCGDTLVPIGIVLADGELRGCRLCGQWASACTEARYWVSMREFDDPLSTLPKPGSEGRRRQQSARGLMRIARFLGRRPAQIRLLDVGCSSGAFLRAAVELGFDATRLCNQNPPAVPGGVRPAWRGGGRVRRSRWDA